MNYKLCDKHDLLRYVGVQAREVVSTTALHELLGEERYQACVKHFVYRGTHVRPDEVELFLRKHFRLRQKGRQA